MVLSRSTRANQQQPIAAVHTLPDGVTILPDPVDYLAMCRTGDLVVLQPTSLISLAAFLDQRFPRLPAFAVPFLSLPMLVPFPDASKATLGGLGLQSLQLFLGDLSQPVGEWAVCRVKFVLTLGAFPIDVCSRLP